MKVLLLLALSLTANAFASSNVVIPVLNCELTSEDIAELKESKSYSSESFTILADIENAFQRTDGKAVLVFSNQKVGEVLNQKEKSLIASAEFGTFLGSNLEKSGEFRDGIIFKGDLVDYNHKYKSVSVLKLKVNQNKIEAELKRDPKGESDYTSVSNYKCSSPADEN